MHTALSLTLCCLAAVFPTAQVLDCNDVCPDNVDLAHSQDAPDSDGDGVRDCNDLCPLDATRINDADSDGDSVSVRCSGLTLSQSRTRDCGPSAY